MCIQQLADTYSVIFVHLINSQYTLEILKIVQLWAYSRKTMKLLQFGCTKTENGIAVF